MPHQLSTTSWNAADTSPEHLHAGSMQGAGNREAGNMQGAWIPSTSHLHMLRSKLD